ncbi:hypothetical protein OF83DRAFT_1163860 [Amylostereum chailletii]|nr:hypothetical protein OF83DRAFT_1163860 [Amylostereum chailletii]
MYSNVSNKKPDVNEILLVHRNPQANSFGGAYVFPGGNFDAHQDDSYEMTAIRETFEESGLLLASSQGSHNITDTEMDTSREAVHSQKIVFKDFLAQNNLTPDTHSLLPFTQWVTPPPAPRRFHARFFVAFLPSVASTGFTSGQVQQRLPTPDGGQEVIEARFLHPLAALSEFRAGRISLMPPQYYILVTLADILQGNVASVAQRARVEALSATPFGSMVVHPHRHHGKEVPEGFACLAYPGDEATGGPKGRLHRSYIRFSKGTTAEIDLKRNFDMFTELEHTDSKSKL